MIDYLGPAVIALTAGVGVLVIALTVVRLVIRGRARRVRAFQPSVSRVLGRYLSGAGPAPAPASRAERDALNTIALAALVDLTGREREVVAHLLAGLGYVDEAAAGLTSRRVSIRRRSAEELARIAVPDSIGALTGSLDDPDVLVRTSCARTLAVIGDAALCPRIAAVAARDAALAPGAAAAVVLALGRNRPAAMEPLLAQDAPAAVRLVAVRVAGRLRLAELAWLLRGCLTGDAELAAAAAEGLGMIGDFDAVAGLRELAIAPGRPPRARTAAATALGAIGDVAAVPVLESLLTAKDWALRAAASGALTRLGLPGEDALRRASRLGRPEAREQAEAALAR